MTLRDHDGMFEMLGFERSLAFSALSHALAWAAYLGLYVGLLQDEDLAARLALLFPVAFSGVAFLWLLDLHFRKTSHPMASVAVESLVVVAAGFGISVVWQFHLPLEAKVAVALVVGGMASALLLAAVRPVLWICALLLVFFCLLGALSVGIFFLPAAVALLIAAAVFRPAKSPALKFPWGLRAVRDITSRCPLLRAFP